MSVRYYDGFGEKLELYFSVNCTTDNKDYPLPVRD